MKKKTITDNEVKVRIICDKDGFFKSGDIMLATKLVEHYKSVFNQYDLFLFSSSPLHEQLSYISEFCRLQFVVVDESLSFKRVYISLPISEHDIEERKAEAYKAKFRAFRAFGFKRPIDIVNVITPFEVNYGVDVDDYARQMGNDTEAILNSDAVYFCKGWQNSNGCTAEYEIARIYGKEMHME